MPKAKALKQRPEMARRLVELRQSAGLSQIELAARIGTTHSNIGFWEVSGTPPRGEVLPALARALGVSVDVLLGVTPPKPKPQPAKGRLQKVFEAAAKLPRRQQEKIAELVEMFVEHHGKAA